jgi:hypothetical protein
MFVR